MISFWKQSSLGLQSTGGYERGCWMNVISPTPSEIKKLKAEYHVPEDFINDTLDPDERSRSEIEGRWLLLIIRIPMYNSDNDLPYTTIPLGILISANMVATICLAENEITNDLLTNRLKNLSLQNKHNFVLHLFLRSAYYYLKFLKEINRHITLIEREIEVSMRNSELNRMLKAEKCLVFFMTSLKSNEILLNKLQRAKFTNDEEVDEDLLEDVLIENKQAVEMSKIYSDILSGMMNGFGSVISNNLNNVMKQLTSITIILMIPTLVASIYGMNVPNFMEAKPYAIYMILAISVVISSIGAYFFRRRKWF